MLESGFSVLKLFFHAGKVDFTAHKIYIYSCFIFNFVFLTFTYICNALNNQPFMYKLFFSSISTVVWKKFFLIGYLKQILKIASRKGKLWFCRKGEHHLIHHCIFTKLFYYQREELQNMFNHYNILFLRFAMSCMYIYLYIYWFPLFLCCFSWYNAIFHSISQIDNRNKPLVQCVSLTSFTHTTGALHTQNV